MKPLLLSLSILVLFGACKDRRPEATAVAAARPAGKPFYQALLGTWVRRTKTGFTLIEIRDTSDVLYKEYFDRGGKDGYFYYRSKGTMGYWSPKAIWISTDKFRFDYKVKSDTLTEFDKEADAGTFIKVYTDEEKEGKTN